VLVDDEGAGADGGRRPVDLQLEWVLGKMPQKQFEMRRVARALQPLALPAGLSVRDALQRVLRLPAVASKRYLTNKVCVCVSACVCVCVSEFVSVSLCVFVCVCVCLSVGLCL